MQGRSHECVLTLMAPGIMIYFFKNIVPNNDYLIAVHLAIWKKELITGQKVHVEGSI